MKRKRTPASVVLRKERKTLLDPYRATLYKMEDEHKTLEEMQRWLMEEQGFEANLKLISYFLEKRRQRRLNDELLRQIFDSAQQCKDVEAALVQNPAPAMDTLVKMHRVFIMNLSSRGTKNPQMLRLADQLTKTVRACINDEVKVQLKERQLALAEARVAEARKSDQLKALEGCQERLESFPDVKELFDQAFAALRTKVKPV